MSENLESLKSAIRNRLVELGWTGEEYTAIASKEYETAVGLKTAHVYVQDFGKDEDTVLLTGDYQSEGRNCLSTTMVSIPKTAVGAEVHAFAEKFAVQADAAVAQSYAARLHRLANAA
jgi:hypothetical protein